MSLDFKSSFDDTAYQAAMRRMTSDAARTAQRVIGEFGALQSRVSGFMASIGGGVAAGAIASAFGRISAYADNVNDLATGLQLTTTEFQRLSGVFGLGGTEAEKFSKGIMTFNGSLEEARNGNEKTLASFARLGVSLKDIKTKSSADLLMQVSDGMANASDKAGAFAAAADLVGKGQVRMISTLSQGSEEFEKQASKITAASASSLAAVDALGDGFTAVKNNALAAGTEGLGGFLKAASAVLPPIVKVTEELAKQSALYQDIQRLIGAAGLLVPEPMTQPQLPPVTVGGGAQMDLGGPNRLSANAKATGDAVGEMNRQRQFQDAMENLKGQQKAAEEIEKHAERTAKIYRDLYKDGLNDAEKLTFLDRERALIAKQLAASSGLERAALKEKLADKNSEWLTEKRIQAERAKQQKVQALMTQMNQAQGRLQTAKDNQLNFELADPNQRRQMVRDERAQKRAEAAIGRRDRAHRERGATDARFGAKQKNEEVMLSEASVQKLAAELAKLVPK